MAVILPLHFDTTRARRALTDALNGDADTVHAATRRGLIALAQELDENRISDLQVHKELIDGLNDNVTSMRKQLRTAQALFGTTAVGMVLALVGVVVQY